MNSHKNPIKLKLNLSIQLTLNKFRYGFIYKYTGFSLKVHPYNNSIETILYMYMYSLQQILPYRHLKPQAIKHLLHTSTPSLRIARIVKLSILLKLIFSSIYIIRIRHRHRYNPFLDLRWLFSTCCRLKIAAFIKMSHL